MSRRIFTLVRRTAGTVAAGVLVSLCLPASPASAGVPFGSWESIVPYHTLGKCLEVADWSENDGAPVRQWDCTSGQNQKWQAVAAPGDDYYTAVVYNRNSGKCLEVADWSRADGAQVRQWTCTGGANQKWVFRWLNGNMIIKNLNSQKCLEIADWSRDNGAAARQWTCHWGDNQQFV